MHVLGLGIGMLLVLIIVIHIIFRVIKFTISVFFLGIVLILVVYGFQQYLGIDLLAGINRYI